MIRVVSFDIGNTIIYTGKKSKLDIICKKYNLEKRKVLSNYKKSFQQNTTATFENSVKRFCKNVGISYNNDTLIFFKKIFYKKNKKIYIKKYKLIKTIKALKKLNYKIILFSNNSYYTKDKIDKKILKYVDKIFNSYDLGYCKGSKESYRLIEKYMHCSPEEFLHIGNSYYNDYLCSIRNGWNAFIYNNSRYNSIKLKDILTYLDWEKGINKNIVVLKKYNKLYKNIFEMEKDKIKERINKNLVIEHIGSTSIKGLISKPIIDIAIFVNKLESILKYKNNFLKLGYKFREDGGIKGEYLLSKNYKNNRNIIIHVVAKNSIRYKNFLYFKKFLLSHKTYIKKYNKLKKRLLKKYSNNRKKYTEEKNDFIQKVIYEYKKYNK